MPRGTLYKPTEEQRKTVRGMSGFGIPHDDIATILDIDPKTLRKHFEWELKRGSIEATAKVAQSLFNMATVDKSVAAAIFWMKARAGWREKHDVNVDVSGTVNVANLDDANLDETVRRELASFLVSGPKGKAEAEHTGPLN
jgi:hypothetical protein